MTMINMNFDQRVVIHTGHQDWQPSPRAGVWRKVLAREDAERGHATSIVRYDPGAMFSAHNHPKGEEILVLAGTFSDETGDFPAGTYFRNPEGFRHTPFSKAGCLILVKLHQFQDDDHLRVCIDTHNAAWQPGPGNLQLLPLHEFGREQVALIRLPAGEQLRSRTDAGGEEIYVVSGELIDARGRYPAGTWIRNPDKSVQHTYVEADTLVWSKSGHLL